jgi:hypothetical protein
MLKIITFIVTSVFFSLAYAQERGDIFPSNFGFSFNLLGPFFGQYEAGVTSYLNLKMQTGFHAIYYSSSSSNPEINGWQSEFRLNYYFTTWQQNGFFLGAASGIEALKVKETNHDTWTTYEDITWAVLPGYNWIMDSNVSLALDLKYGYSMGDIQFNPEVSFVFLF